MSASRKTEAITMLREWLAFYDQGDLAPWRLAERTRDLLKKEVATKPLATEAPHNGVSTSAAAATATTKVLNALQYRVLLAIAASLTGLTNDEYDERTDSRHQASSPRFKELRDAGLIERIGKRKTRGGSEAFVHAITAAGRTALASRAPAVSFDPRVSIRVSDEKGAK